MLNNGRGKRHVTSVHLSLKMTLLSVRECGDSQQAFRSRESYNKSYIVWK